MAPKDDLRINLSTDRLSRLKCTECGHKNPGDVEFCTKCRAKMVLECADCGFKSPQGSEFCGSCGNETEFGIKERQSREREEAKAARERWERKEEAEAALEAKFLARQGKEAKAAAAERAPKTSFQKVRHGIANVFYLLGFFCVLFPVLAVVKNSFDPFMTSHWWEVVGVGVAGAVFFGLVASAIDPPIYRDHY